MANEKLRRVILKSTRGYRDRELGEFATIATSTVGLLAGADVEIPGPTPATPGEPFEVPHSLQAVPDTVQTIDPGDNAGGIAYATIDDKAKWRKDSATIRCTVGSEINLTVRFARNPQ